MKRLLIIVAAMAVWQLSPAQIGARWWFDDGGGDSQIQGMAVENQLQIDVSTLSRGYHTLYIQPLDTSNLEQINPTTLSTRWMPPRKYTVYIDNPIAEPPVAWTDQAYASRQTLGDGTSLVEVSSAAIGFHTLYVHWGGMLQHRVYYRSAMQGEEQAYYWLDNARNPSPLTSSAIDVTALPVGFHTLYVGKGNQMKEATLFYRTDTVRQGRYWVDDSAPLVTTLQTNTLAIDVASLTAGFHTVHIAIGHQVCTALFYKTDTLAHYTLWIDEDFDSRLTGTTSGTIVADVSELSDTIHTAYIAIGNRIESYDFLKVPVSYTVQVLTVDSLKGTVAGGGEFAKGSTASISATAEYGYHLGQWSDGDTNSFRDIVVMSDTTLTAYFVPDTFQFDVSVGDTAMGSVEVTGTSEYLGTDTATAIPNYGYHFVGWSDGDTTNPRLVTLTQDTALTALFAPNIYTVTLITDTPGWGSVLGSGDYPYLTVAPIEAVATLGYQFKQWNDGNTDNPRSLVVRGDTTLTAAFELQRYLLTVHSNDLSRGFTQGGGTFSVLDTATALAITLAGNSFLGWDDGATDNPRQMQLWCDTTVTALFGAIDSIPETIVVHDTVTMVEIDTLVVIDTVSNTVYDTVDHYIFDTTYIDVPVHDTTVVTVTDTVINTVYDTVTNTVYDTVSNTVYDTINHYVHDTTYIDVPVHDTTVVTVTDTVTLVQTDTVINTVHDTVNNYVYDTTLIHDTTLVTDTLWMTQTDTVYITEYVYDTIYIHDTIYVGVDEVEVSSVKLYQREGRIVVEGAEGQRVMVFDAVGRVVAESHSAFTGASSLRGDDRRVTFEVPASGVYLVKIGDFPARRVVVIR